MQGITAAIEGMFANLVCIEGLLKRPLQLSSPTEPDNTAEGVLARNTVGSQQFDRNGLSLGSGANGAAGQGRTEQQ
jgi:hypothetical protein